MANCIRPLSLIGFGGLVLCSAGLGMLIHRVSPLRDPSFVVNSANAGTLAPWLQWVSETAWLWISFGLAALLALSTTWVLYQWSRVTSSRWGIGRWLAITTVLFVALGFSGYAISDLYWFGSQVNWFKAGMVALLAALLAANFTGMIWFWQQVRAMLAQIPEPARALRRWGQAHSAFYWAGMSASLFAAFQILFLAYLFAQHMVD